MSDLKEPPNAPLAARNPGQSARLRRFALDLPIIFGVCVAACAGAPVRAPGAARGPAVVHVDERAAVGGDGSPQAPFRTPPAGLGAGVTVRLHAGLYRGPFQLAAGATWEGEGEVVLYGEGPGAVVEAWGGTLRHLSVQGGQVGVRAHGEVRLEAVHFSGHRVAGLEALPGSRVTVQGAHFEAALPGVPGVTATGAQVALAQVRFEGGWHRAVTARDSRVTVRQARFLGVAEALHLVGCETRLDDVDIRAGRGTAVFAAGGALAVAGLTVQGHEAALRTGPGVTLLIDGLSAQGAQEVGLALVGATGSLRHLRLEGTGPLGAVQVEPGPGGRRGDGRRLVLGPLTVRHARSLGVSVHQSWVRLDEVDIDGVQQEPNGDGTGALGDALHVADADVEVGTLRVGAAEGSAVWVTAGAALVADTVTSAGAQQGALVVERSASAAVGALVVSGGAGPALSAWEQASASVGRLEVAGGAGPVLWVDCASGARAKVGPLTGAPEPEPSACVERTKAPNTAAVPR